MDPGVRVTWKVLSPGTSAGALALIQLVALTEQELNGALEALGIGPVRPGVVVLRDLLGADRGLVARFDGRSALLMPHGGLGVVRAVCAGLAARGIPEAALAEASTVFSEAADEVEARMLATLGRSHSPLAIDILLDQPRRWREAGVVSDLARDRILNRLVDPALVVALGASNIGKSSLANVLAGRAISVVADEPGTTRDHVGAMIDMAGLVVRYVDTPGIREEAGEIEAEARAISMELASRADLVLLCADHEHAAVEWSAGSGRAHHQSVLRVGLRDDLGPARGGVDCSVSARLGRGVGELVAGVRERLVPAAALAHPGPWKFW